MDIGRTDIEALARFVGNEAAEVRALLVPHPREA
jgi:hypothetical protein